MSEDNKDIKSQFIEQFSTFGERGIALTIFSHLESKIDKCYMNLCKDSSRYNDLINSLNVCLKIKILYSFGIIDKDSFNDLENIRIIRNKFAHEMSINSFSDPKITEILSKIKMNPRTAAYGSGNEHETYHDEHIKKYAGNHEYPGYVYIEVCRGYASRFQANSNNISTTLDLDYFGFKNMPAFSGKTAKLLFQIF
ncbi:hypothetical protein LDL36_14085 [Komagataeibacter sp. FNDCR1]|nr:hypothetical protein [Komagataeibacter sp. FNDCR1]